VWGGAVCDPGLAEFEGWWGGGWGWGVCGVIIGSGAGWLRGDWRTARGMRERTPAPRGKAGVTIQRIKTGPAVYFST